jgi:hypothetical protein
MRSYWSWVGPLIQYDWILIKRRNADRQAECQMNMKAEIRVMHIQTKEHQRLPASHQQLREKMEQILHHRPQKEPTLTKPWS